MIGLREKAGERDVEARAAEQAHSTPSVDHGRGTRSDARVKYFSRILLVMAGWAVLSYAQDEKGGPVPRFESDIRPILAANCLICHGSEFRDLTYERLGRHERLTDEFPARVVKEILA